jgi:hypothetical protein
MLPYRAVKALMDDCQDIGIFQLGQMALLEDTVEGL